MSDDVTITVGGQQLSGWTDTSVTLSMEQIPNAFRLTATDKSPVSGQAVMVQEGADCQIKLGADVVITGYVDTVAPGYDATSHLLTISGRGKCQDLADCSAEWKGSQVSGTSALDIAQKLSKPYGITAVNNGPAGPKVPQFNINVGDTPLDVLEKVTRHAGLLYFEDAKGNLVLAQAGAGKAASGFTEGQNVQGASYQRNMATRYSDYWASMLGIYTGAIFEESPGQFFGQVKDPNVKRNRKLFLVAESVEGGKELAENRVKWEAARRMGRGRQVNLVADSWRDSAGKLWAPNSLAPVALPRLQLAGEALCIATVTFAANLKDGKTAQVTLMPKEAFLPQPIQLVPVIQGLTPSGSASQPAPAQPQAASGA